MRKKLTRAEFDCLVSLLERENFTSGDESTYQSLQAVGYVNKAGITPAGKAALEPYRAKRAILLAAGFGSRMSPITINTPKPLVRVNGTRIIDTLLDAILGAGITEIYIVRGYLGEQFDQLLKKYPMIHFLENPVYSKTNSISSVFVARHLLQNAYILEGDLFVRNPKIICPYHFSSNYLGVPTNQTDDWCFITQNGVIRDWKISGKDCFHQVGISFWDSKYGKTLEEHIKISYEKGECNIFWDQVPLLNFHESYQVEVRICTDDDIVEIDTYEELKAIDKNYVV